MEKMVIMHIAQSAGGVDKYLSMLLSNMDKEKFKQILVCSFDYIPENYISITDIIKQIDMNREIKIFNDFSSILKIRKLIKLYQPDIIYCHSSKGGALGRLAHIGLKNKAKIIYNPHGWSFNMKGSIIKKKFYIFTERILSKITDHFITISKIEKYNAISKRISKEENISVIYNGIDIRRIENTEFTLNRKVLKIPSDAYIIGMVGRISEQKAPDIFVKAAVLIKKQIPESFFLIVGDGELRSYIEDIIRANQLQNSVLITGWVPNAIDYIKLFDVATLLSRWEGFGLVLAEYMAIKKPIVATEVDAIPEIIINETNGLLVQIDSPEIVCDAILRIKGNKCLLENMVEAGSRIVREKFDIVRVAKEHTELFQSFIENSKKN